MKYVFVFWSLISLAASQSEDITCSKKYCENWKDQNECPPLEPIEDKEIIEIISATPCNCCDYYLVKLEFNETCQVGTVSTSAPSKVCGDGLYCELNDSHDVEGTCQQIKTPCTAEQGDWDERRKKGTLGNMETRPKCDRNGKYAPLKCIPEQTCYCLSEDGVRIFGDTVNKHNVEREVKCTCSRAVDSANKIINNDKFKTPTLRCLPNGNYDELQCVGATQCMCVDDYLGIPSETDWYKKAVNITDIGKDTLECFDEDLHITGEFLKKCEVEYEEVKEQILNFEDNNIEILGLTLPSCQPDGSYSRVQETYTSKYCSLPDGQMIKNYTVPIESELAKSMTCNCAWASFIMESDNIISLPDCCKNGNYKKIQCRNDECRCVDRNGNQVAVQVLKENKNELPCYDENNSCT